MWNASTLTIMFRGLLVMHKMETGNGRSYFEIGVLKTEETEGHFLRIHVIKNCALARVIPLDHKVRPRHPIWRLRVDHPIGEGVSTYTIGPEPFNRRRHPVDRDFRWINDLEGPDFYNRDLTDELDLQCLRPILHVPYGVFYTRLRTRVAQLKNGDLEPNFGHLSSVTACDIPILGGGAKIVEADTGRVIYRFKPEQNTIFEFTNTPPDIGHGHGMRSHADARSTEEDEQHEARGEEVKTEEKSKEGEHTEDASKEHQREAAPEDHFQLYYAIFRDQNIDPHFGFEDPSEASDPSETSATSLGPMAPDPALCGPVNLGRRRGGLK